MVQYHGGSSIVLDGHGAAGILYACKLRVCAAGFTQALPIHPFTPYQATAPVMSRSTSTNTLGQGLSNPQRPCDVPKKNKHYSMPLCNAQTGISVLGGPLEAHSPLVHVRLAGQPEEPDEAEAALQRVADAALARGLLIVVHRVSNLDKFRGAPSLRCVPAAGPAYVKDCFDVLGAAPDAHDDAGSGRDLYSSALAAGQI